MDRKFTHIFLTSGLGPYFVKSPSKHATTQLEMVGKEMLKKKKKLPPAKNTSLCLHCLPMDLLSGAQEYSVCTTSRTFLVMSGALTQAG